MRTRASQHRRRTAYAVFLAFVCLVQPGAELNSQRQPDRAVESRMEQFFAAVDTLGPTGLAEFFPKTGTFTYRHTIHQTQGDQSFEWRFPASEITAALAGPLWASFEIQFEGQPIGLFAHQLMERPGQWRRISRARFVPPGANACSATYIEWRLEGLQWVISELGDEHFQTGPLPSWCC
jgi:hypothetical protein